MDTIEQFIFKSLHKLIADPSVNDTSLNKIIDFTKDLVSGLVSEFNQHLQNEMKKLKNEVLLSPVLMSQNIQNLTLYRLQKKIMNKSPVFIKPNTFQLGLRSDIGYVDGKFKRQQVEESLCYFNVFDTISGV